MSNTQKIKEIKTKIEKLKKGLSGKTSASLKAKARQQISKYETEIKSLQGSGKKTSSGKSTSGAEKAKQISLKLRKNQGLSTSKSDIEKDAGRPALKSGKRTSKDGNTYYEYRENRIDRRPQKYARLADGGMIGDRVKVSDFTDYAYYNTLEQAKEYADNLRARGYEAIVTESPSGYEAKHRVLWKKNIRDSRNEKRVYADGGMMAKGGMTEKEKLTKELMRLQRELNSSRLSRYIEGDTSEEEMARQREREVKLKKFYEILEILRESEKMADGGMMAKGSLLKANEEEKKELKILSALSGHNEGLTLNGLLEAMFLSDYRFGKYATQSEVKQVETQLKSLIKKGFVEKGGLGYKITQRGADYRRLYDFGSYADGGAIQDIGGTKFSTEDLSGMFAKGGGIYSSDDAYKVEVYSNDKLVDIKTIRARNQKEANEMAEDMEDILKKKHGSDLRIKVTKAMSYGGELHRSQEGMYAKGGMLEHGLRIGDEVKIYRGNRVIVKNKHDETFYQIDLNTGERQMRDKGSFN